MINKENALQYKNIESNLNKEKELLRTKKALFEEENNFLTINIKILTEKLLSCKDNLEIEGYNEYMETKEKKLSFGLGVRISEDLLYNDREALEWAKEHSMCLKLDKTAFKKVAKVQDLDIVTRQEKITITFPMKGLTLEE